MCGGCTLYQPLALYAPRGGEGLSLPHSGTHSSHHWGIQGHWASEASKWALLSPQAPISPRCSMALAHWTRPPPTVSSTDAVSGLRIRYFTLQLLLLLLLRLPLQVSLERNYSYYYSVPPRPISRTRLGLYTLPDRFWSVKKHRRLFHHYHIYRPQQALDDPRDRIRCLCRCATPAARHASD